MGHKRYHVNFVIILVMIFSPFGNLFSQDDDTNTKLNPWGRFKIMLIATDKNIGIVDGGSRLGLRVSKKVKPGIRIFGGIELSVLLNSNDKFLISPDNGSSTGFLNVSTSDPGNVFGIRKGFVGADFNEYGTVSLGKQTGAYYEVASITDISENNSGYASYVYTPDGTDGGATGTGRASNSVVYKNTLGNFNVALAAQFKLSEEKFNSFINSIGGSVIYKLPLNMYLGAAFNNVFLDPNTGNRIRGLHGKPVYAAACFNYSTDDIFCGVTYAYQENGDIATSHDSTVVYSGYGIEIAAKWVPFKKWSILGGVNYKHPNNVDALINKNFCRLVYFYGLQFEPLKDLLFYLEGAVDRSVTPEGGTMPDNLSFGVKLDF